MPRPNLPLNTFGEITATELPTSTKRKPRWRARARYRGIDGRVVQVEKTGPTKTEAKNLLRSELATRQRRYETAAVDRAATVGELAEEWVRTAGRDWSTNTRERYELALRKQVLPLLGAVRLVEWRRSLVNRALETIIETSGPGAAKSAKAVMSGMAKLGMANDVLDVNPTIGTISIHRAGDVEQVRALTVAEEADLVSRLSDDKRAKDLDLPDLVTFMLGTAARIGEVCACRHSSLSLRDGAGHWEINATAVRVKKIGMTIQERPKTAAGWRVLALPAHCVALLERREERMHLSDGAGVVFGSPRSKGIRDPSNTSGDLREVLDRLGYPWVSSHTFRKSALTRLDEAGLPARVISDYAGHAQISMTQDVYLGRRVVSAEAARILDR